MGTDPFDADLEDDRALGEVLARRASGGTDRWPVSITDLLDPRPAFSRRYAAVPTTPDRQRRRAAGREHHLAWLRQLGRPEEVEVRVVRDGVVGVIDLFGAEGPSELKSSGHPIPVERWPSERGRFLDQLGLYCVLTDRSVGWLAVVGEGAAGAAVGAPRVAKVQFADLEQLRQEAAARAERFRRAVRSGEPAELPRCRWRGLGCGFGAVGGACRCTGAEAPDDRWVLDRLAVIEEDHEAEARWSSAIAAASADPPATLRSFRDLQLPRRAWYERNEPERAEAGWIPDPTTALAFQRLQAALDEGPPGETGRLLPPAGAPPGTIPTFRGEPSLVKVSRASVPHDPAQRGELAETYRVELGLRCAAVGAEGGWVFVRYVRGGAADRPLRAFHLRFENPASLREESAHREALLRSALLLGSPKGLPACPSWRARDCPYADRCGCGAESPIS